MTNTTLRPDEISKGLRQVLRDGLATEAMSCLTEGTFLVALALQLGASNFQIGLLAALPTFTNVFQWTAIWLVRRSISRRWITVVALTVARAPLFLVGILPFWLPKDVALNVITLLMGVHYLFGSIAGASWNSWVKDLVPRDSLGTYFSHRTRLTQTLNIVLSLALAFATNYVSAHYPELVPSTFPVLFFIGGLAGMMSVVALYRAPEPAAIVPPGSLRNQFSEVVADKNFGRLLIFNCWWAFAFNLAAPFFSVYMMKTMGLPISQIMLLTIAGQLSGILFIKIWGKYADLFSNKAIIFTCIPIYIVCLAFWITTGSLAGSTIALPFLAIIHILSGAATSGINLSLSNAGLKLAKAEHAITYLATKNMVTSLFSAVAPLVAGLVADSLDSRTFEWSVSIGDSIIPVIHLQGFGFFFLASIVLVLVSTRLLRQVNETGDVRTGVIMSALRNELHANSQNIVSNLAVSKLRVIFRSRASLRRISGPLGDERTSERKSA
jgi:hypothetical protein